MNRVLKTSQKVLVKSCGELWGMCTFTVAYYNKVTMIRFFGQYRSEDRR